MRILVDQGGYGLTNLGDHAMLQVTLGRMRRLLPEAQFTVLGHDEEQLQRAIPGVKAVTTSGRRSALGKGSLLAGVGRWLPGMEWSLQVGWPERSAKLARFRGRLARKDVARMGTFQDALFGCDLVVNSGGGYLNDEFPGHVEILCRMLEMAHRLDKPFAMFGIGAGPLADPRLRGWCQRALPHARLICGRDSRGTPQLLESLGVPTDRLRVTGDDAIEPALALAPAELGSHIGVSVRFSSYSAVDQDAARHAGGVVGEFAAQHSARLLPCPVDVAPDCDSRSIASMFPGAECSEVSTVEDLIRQIGQCRMVVTGTYHAAVFALAQGIPAVCLARSEYYVGKHGGLAELFGKGCHVVRLDDADCASKLRQAMEEAWSGAGKTREPLLAAARHQVQLAQDAYAEFARSLRM